VHSGVAMRNYYSQKLNAERLVEVYAIAPPRVQQYLRAEVAHVLGKIRRGDVVLDLGCGYGRIMPELAQKAGSVIGIDISEQNIELAKKFLKNSANCSVKVMNAIDLRFPDELSGILSRRNFRFSRCFILQGFNVRFQYLKA